MHPPIRYGIEVARDFPDRCRRLQKWVWKVSVWMFLGIIGLIVGLFALVALLAFLNFPKAVVMILGITFILGPIWWVRYHWYPKGLKARAVAGDLTCPQCGEPLLLSDGEMVLRWRRREQERFASCPNCGALLQAFDEGASILHMRELVDLGHEQWAQIRRQEGWVQTLTFSLHGGTIAALVLGVWLAAKHLHPEWKFWLVYGFPATGIGFWTFLNVGDWAAQIANRWPEKGAPSCPSCSAPYRTFLRPWHQEQGHRFITVCAECRTGIAISSEEMG